MQKVGTWLAGAAAIAFVASCAAHTPVGTSRAPGASEAPSGARPDALGKAGRYALLDAPVVCPPTCVAANLSGSFEVEGVTQRFALNVVDRSTGNDVGYLNFSFGGTDYTIADGFPASNFALQIVGSTVNVSGTPVELGGGSSVLPPTTFTYNFSGTPRTITLVGTAYPLTGGGLLAFGSCEFVEPD